MRIKCSFVSVYFIKFIVSISCICSVMAGHLSCRGYKHLSVKEVFRSSKKNCFCRAEDGTNCSDGVGLSMGYNSMSGPVASVADQRCLCNYSLCKLSNKYSGVNSTIFASNLQWCRSTKQLKVQYLSKCTWLLSPHCSHCTSMSFYNPTFGLLKKKKKIKENYAFAYRQVVAFPDTTAGKTPTYLYNIKDVF